MGEIGKGCGGWREREKSVSTFRLVQSRPSTVGSLLGHLSPEATGRPLNFRYGPVLC